MYSERENINWPERLQQQSEAKNITVYENNEVRYTWEYQVTRKTNKNNGLVKYQLNGFCHFKGVDLKNYEKLAIQAEDRSIGDFAAFGPPAYPRCQCRSSLYESGQTTKDLMEVVVYYIRQSQKPSYACFDGIARRWASSIKEDLDLTPTMDNCRVRADQSKEAYAGQPGQPGNMASYSVYWMREFDPKIVDGLNVDADDVLLEVGKEY